MKTCGNHNCEAFKRKDAFSPAQVKCEYCDSTLVELDQVVSVPKIPNATPESPFIQIRIKRSYAWIIALGLIGTIVTLLVVFWSKQEPTRNEDHDNRVDLLKDARELQEFASENVNAARLPDDDARREALEEIAARMRERGNKSDYGITYELVKNRVYGGRHVEGFALLRTAARQAIAVGEAEYLLDRIKEEKKHRDGPIWKLATGHPHDWDPIIEALEHEDAEKLAEEAEGGQHDEH